MGSTLDNDQQQLMGGWNYCSAFLASKFQNRMRFKMIMSIFQSCPPRARSDMSRAVKNQKIGCVDLYHMYHKLLQMARAREVDRGRLLKPLE
jgi:hypothetical protein